jgi:hypothetical protein
MFYDCFLLLEMCYKLIEVDWHYKGLRNEVEVGLNMLSLHFPNVDCKIILPG